LKIKVALSKWFLSLIGTIFYTDGKLKLAKRTKKLGLDALHDTVHEMCKDEARHGKTFLELLKRHFG